MKLQKGVDATIVDSMVKTLECWADEIGQPAMAALTKLLDAKLGAHKKNSERGNESHC